MKGPRWGKRREGYGFSDGNGLFAGAEEVEDFFDKGAETGWREFRHCDVTEGGGL